MQTWSAFRLTRIQPAFTRPADSQQVINFKPTVEEIKNRDGEHHGSAIEGALIGLAVEAVGIVAVMGIVKVILFLLR